MRRVEEEERGSEAEVGVRMPVFPSGVWKGRSQWPSGLRRGCAADRLLGLRVRIPPGAWMSVCCECCQVKVSATGRSLVQRSPTDCGVSLCDQETSRIRRPWPALGCCVRGKNTRVPHSLVNDRLTNSTVTEIILDFLERRPHQLSHPARLLMKRENGGISGFRCGWTEFFRLLGYYAA